MDSTAGPVSLTRRLRRVVGLWLCPVVLCGLKSPGSRLHPPFFGDAIFFYTAMHRAAATRGAACAAPPAPSLRRAAFAATSAPRRLTPRRLSPGSASHRLASPVRPCLRPAPPCEDISKCSPSPLSLLCLSLWASLSNPNLPRPNYVAQSINVIDSYTFFNLARVGKPHTPTSVSVFLIHCENMSLLIFNQRTGRTRRRPSCVAHLAPVESCMRAFWSSAEPALCVELNLMLSHLFFGPRNKICISNLLIN